MTFWQYLILAGMAVTGCFLLWGVVGAGIALLVVVAGTSVSERGGAEE